VIKPYKTCGDITSATTSATHIVWYRMKAITFNDKMANRRASIILLLAIALKSTHSLQNLVEGKRESVCMYLVSLRYNYNDEVYSSYLYTVADRN